MFKRKNREFDELVKTSLVILMLILAAHIVKFLIINLA